MSEHLTPNHETNEAWHPKETKEASVEQREKQTEKHKTPEQDVHSLEKKAKANALQAKEVNHGNEHKTPAEPIIGLQRQIKNNAYGHTLKRVRSKLSSSEKAFSKVIHQPVVESLSELGSKTTARPTGLLGAGFAVFVGSAALLYLSKHYGFSYNFTVFIVLFALGFLLGLIIEALARLVHRSSR